ncbi:MAG: T9SS type A sorting domain-containing protein [Flavobacteriales bacterium]
MNKLLLSFLFIGAVISSHAQPVITKNPVSQMVCADTCINLIVKAVGISSASYVYTWQADQGSGFADINFSGEGFDTLELCGNSVIAPKTINYRCIVFDTNDFSDTSNAAVISYDSCSLPIADFDISFSSVTERCFTNTSKHANNVTWSFGDGVTESVDTPCHNYDSQWIFDVTLYAFNNYGSDKKTVTLDLLSVAELESRFSIYPNPVADKLYIDSDIHIESAQLYDLKGQLVTSSETQTDGYLVNTASLPSGVYNLILSAGGQLTCRKIVKH